MRFALISIMLCAGGACAGLLADSMGGSSPYWAMRLGPMGLLSALVVRRWLPNSKTSSSGPADCDAAACHWEKVDASWFAKGLYKAMPHETVEGPVASFYPDGQLKVLCHFYGGKPSTTHNRMDLEHGLAYGVVHSDSVHCEYMQGKEDFLIVMDGENEHQLSPMEWREWVEKWITQIAGPVRVTYAPKEL